MGCSWIELLALFELSGGSLDICNNGMHRKATARDSIRPLLLSFKYWCKLVWKLCLHHGDQTLFKPCRLDMLRLKPLGFSTFTSCLMSLPVLPPGTAEALTHAVLTLRDAVTNNIKKNLAEGLHKVLPIKIKLVGVP